MPLVASRIVESDNDGGDIAKGEVVVDEEFSVDGIDETLVEPPVPDTDEGTAFLVWLRP